MFDVFSAGEERKQVCVVAPDGSGEVHARGFLWTSRKSSVCFAEKPSVPEPGELSGLFMVLVASPSLTHLYIHTKKCSNTLRASAALCVHVGSKRLPRVSVKCSDPQSVTPPPRLPRPAAVAAPPLDTPCRSWSVWRRGADGSAATGSDLRLDKSTQTKRHYQPRP